MYFQNLRSVNSTSQHFSYKITSQICNWDYCIYWKVL